ncbi:DEAD/DEAH box helicase [Natrinema hispanicum]|uniref:CRISPR-associated endonuclease/helicase Cas3 n=1 Tax=Natrinema hispanicum TaxID=392421 RepID=A0A1G6Y020_9EURY|nr:DEAD/DEAH box helicase [Natrinema hispanicum]SDD82976.1 CRISPR-associated endonuclease/helicase Cas3/CRISPR-associated endonuclease Cas3-HD [Natrinema hispanicum]SEU12459.1 CRISPR-associated endonuclease/helicase Cas3 [Natrinema hispanicum]
MTFEQYISHPAKTDGGEPTLLIGDGGRFDDEGHLRTVADRMIEACRGQTLADGTPADPVAEVIGLTHDFAKLTCWAQKHLRNQPSQHSDEYRYHAFPSALVTLYCLLECRDEVGGYAAEVATLVVAGHHDTQSPPESSKLAENYGRTTAEVRETYERVDDQFEDISDEVPERADRIIRAATDGAGSWDDFREWHDDRTEPIGGAHDHLVYFAQMGKRDAEVGYYGDVVRLWTALKLADQTAASGIEESDLDGRLPDRDALDQHVDDLDEGEGVLADLNSLRDQARKDATENAEGLVESDDVGLITLPTGFGKTYAGLSAGLRAADLSDSRLVYALPYTSILDQTASEIQSVFGVSPYSKAFTLHHHLSNTYTGLGDHYTDADIGRSPGALHAESWLSGLTLTTTVQLFESLAAPTARQATRVPSLRESVVVIDEPQAIPEDWWRIVPALVELLVDAYDATVILMTATQPGLVKYGSDELTTRELTDDTAQYTDFLAAHPRVTYRLHDTVRTDLGDEYPTLDYPTAGGRMSEAAGDGRDVLAVCNTRASAEELYRYVTPMATGEEDEPVELGRPLHDYVDETGELPSPVDLRRLALNAVAERDADTVYAFLSGDVRPDDRQLLIDTLYDDEAGDVDDPDPLLERDESVVLVSTSVVEAGVDVSFDTVFRDYAPIPNIVQSGGRCNRSFGGETGDVVVWRLAEPEDGNAIPSLVIHGGDGGDRLPLLRETGRVLRRHAEDGCIDESTMVSDTVGEFYESLFSGELDPGDERLSDAVASASMGELEGEHMIEEIESYEDVVACLTDRERADLLGGDLDAGDIGKHPGAQVNTDPDGWTEEVAVGNSRYLLVDARDASYHPVFGVR